VAVIGGGAAGISACWSIKERHPGKQVHFFFSGAECLPRYHANARANVIRRLEKLGVVCHPHHRAVAPEGCNGLAEDRVVFTPDSPSEWFDADLVVWALGPTGPNTGFLPPGWLSQGGFVKVDKHLRVLGHADIFAVGDCADSDPDRSSARNYGWKVLAKNIELCLSGVTEGPRLQVFKPEPLRWGSVYLSAVDSRMILTLPGGSLTAVPGWVVRYLFIRIVNFMIMLRARPRDPPDQPDRELDTVLREYD
jgi:NADH dehydrogenase FAD-containing subunit